MFTRKQKNICAIWVAGPIAFFLLLNFINPAYMHRHLTVLCPPLNGFWWIVFWQAINFLVLYFGLNYINKRRNSDDGEQKKSYAESALFVFTFLFFTLPACWVTFFYPSIIAVMETDLGY